MVSQAMHRGATSLPARVSRFDRLDIARLGLGHWSLPASTGDATACPFLAFYVVDGSARVHSDATHEIGSGEFLLLANAGSLSVDVAESADLVIIRVPESAVGPYFRAMTASHGRRVPTQSGTASLVAHLVTGLASQPEDYRPENPARLAQHVVGLLALMFADGLSQGGSSHASMLQRAKEYIEAHLADLDLSPDSIAAAQNISTRTLHRLFESEGLTISGWTRARRLENCRVELTDPSLEQLSVSRIGARWGLWDAAHFSRLFKSSFGLAPRAYRSQALGAVHSAERFLERVPA